MHLIKVLHAFYRCLKKRNDKEFMDYVLLEKHGRSMNMNINYDAAMSGQKRALICYLPTDNYEHIDLKAAYHVNQIERYQIVRSFIKHDYCIDVCHCLDVKAIGKLAKEKYDLIFGFGTAYIQAIKQWPDALHIIYYTESPYWYSKQQEMFRIQKFKEKTGIDKELVRTGVHYYEDDEKRSDVIICKCDEALFDKVNKPIYRIVPHGLKSLIIDQNLFLNRSEKHFLVFSMFGYVHKGIDLLIDVVKKHPDWHLHLCGNTDEMDKDRFEYHYSNIHVEGYLLVHDIHYRELVEQCMFVLLPSCSEATGSGVVTCMRHGLIPIVSRRIGLEYCGEDKVFFFEEISEAYIEKRLEQCIHMNRQDLEEMSDRIYEYANKEFSIEAFSTKMDSCIDNILAQ